MKSQINAVRAKIMHALVRNLGAPIEVYPSFSLKKLGKEKRILVIRPNSRLGNLLMLTPLLQEIEKTLPGWQVDLFVRGNLAPVLFRTYPSVGRIIPLPPKPFRQLGAYLLTWLQLRKYGYDLVFNVAESSSSGRLSTRWVRSKAKFFGSPQSELLPPDAVHMAKRPVYNFRTFVARLGLPPLMLPPKPLWLRLTPDELARGKELLRQMAGNDRPSILFYTFATGGKCLQKEWWKPFYAMMKERYGRNYNLLEVLPKENISQIDFASLHYYSTSIREMGAVMAHGAVFITGDCGVMHLASSVGVPTVALFVRDNIRTYEPYNPGSVAFRMGKVSADLIFQKIDRAVRWSVDAR